MKFNLTGYDIDNLLKKLYLKKIPLLNVEKASVNQVSFEIFDADEKRVKRYINNFKIKKTPKFIKRLPKIALVNLGLILGVFFGSIFFMFASNYTWKITVYGTKELSTNEIIEVLKQNGVSTGKINLKSSQDIEYILMNNYDRIAQVSVIKQGTHIIINISEKLVYVEEEYKPITAKYSGIITKINIITGTTNVHVGDFVNIGEVLVLPFNINSSGEKVSVKPIAEIEGKIYITNTISLSKKEKVLKRTGKSTTVYNYKFLNFNLFSGKNKNSFALFDFVSYNENITSIVPLKREVVTYYELDYAEIEHNFEEEKEELKQKALVSAQEMLPQYSKKLREKVTTTIIEDVMYACAVIEVTGFLNG